MKKELLTRDLMLVESGHLIKRYNRALNKVCGFETKLQSFHIDCSGYSPEIAEECGDLDYLNTHGVNKRFIIISIDQANLPVIQSYFSSTAQFIKDFLKDNSRQIMALTAIDAVYGELENNIYRVKTIKDAITSTKIEVKVDTPKKILETESVLKKEIEDLYSKGNDAWLENDSIEKIIQLSKVTGDIRHNKLQPEFVKYEKRFFFTRHFGGLYVFTGAGVNGETVIISKNNIKSEQLPENVKCIMIDDIFSVYEFLGESGLISEIDIDILSENKQMLREKKFQIAIDHMVEEQGTSYADDIDQYEIKKFIQSNMDSLPDKFHKFYDLLVQLEREEEIDGIEPDLIFYLCQPTEAAKKDGNHDLVRHLISFYTPYNYLSTFVYNRELFFDRFEGWSKEKREYVSNYLETNLDSIKEAGKSMR